MRLIRFSAGGFFAVAWLLPNHYFPWASFWQDFAAGIGLALVLWSARPSLLSCISIPATAVAVMLVATIPIVQWLCGLVFYRGEAFVVWLYLAGFSLAVACPATARISPETVLSPLVGAVLLGSIASVGLACAQWLDIGGLGMFLVDFPPGGRPYANLAQPNQLATLLMLGLIATITLHELFVLTAGSTALALAWLLFGLAMTQSRTAWVAMPVLLAWLLWASWRAPLRLRPVNILVIGCGFFSLVIVWPVLCEALWLFPARSLADQTAATGGRLDLWAQMLDAIAREPLWGYGWNQASVAQIRVAADHAPIGQWIEDSHNLVLELLIMQGVPLGLLIAGATSVWLWRRMRDCRDRMTALALGVVLVVGVHALLEFPLDYAYFLLPVGLVIGYIEARSPKVSRLSVPSVVFWTVGVLASLLLARAAYEYADIERRNRAMRFELAGFGSLEPSSPPIPVALLTQLEELPRFARTQARRGMSAAELGSMRKMAERYAYPPVLLRYAMASGLNGDSATARRMLQVLCNVHSAERCDEGMDVWRQMANGAYPELQAVELPPPLQAISTSR